MELHRHPIKDTLKKWLNSSGLKLYKTSTIPSGLMLERDLERSMGLNNIKTIFDVGANVGQAATQFAESCTNAQIYSFEPIYNTFQQLRENTKKFKVEAYNVALGEEETKQTIYLQSYSWLNSLNDKVNRPDEAANKASQEVHIIRLDDFCDSKSIDAIDFLKIDTEGFDLNVLKGARKKLQNRKIKFIMVEVGFSEKDERHSSFSEVSDFLSTYGYRLMGFYNQFTQFDNGHSHLEYADALFHLQDA